MFSFGEQLYRLTSRDEETLLIDPYFRRYVVSLAGAVTNDSTTVPIPLDRALYIDRVIFLGATLPGAFNWTEWRVDLLSPLAALLPFRVISRFAAVTIPLVSDGTIATAASQNLDQTVDVKTVFPPGFNLIRFSAGRSGGVSTATCEFIIHAYLLPPGRVGRFT